MTIYVLTNNDSVILGVFTSKKKANKVRVEIGQRRWHEAWVIVPMQVDNVDTWVLAGSESYQRMLKKLEKQDENV